MKRLFVFGFCPSSRTCGCRAMIPLVQFIFVDKEDNKTQESGIGMWNAMIGWIHERERERESNFCLSFLSPNCSRTSLSSLFQFKRRVHSKGRHVDPPGCRHQSILSLLSLSLLLLLCLFFLVHSFFLFHPCPLPLTSLLNLVLLCTLSILPFFSKIKRKNVPVRGEPTLITSTHTHQRAHFFFTFLWIPSLLIPSQKLKGIRHTGLRMVLIAFVKAVQVY